MIILQHWTIVLTVTTWTVCSTRIKERKFPLKCPGCQNELTDGDIKEAVDEDDMEKYIEYSFTKYIHENLSKMSWCPTIDCRYVIEMDPNQSKFDCQQCIFAYCLSCKCDWHNNMTFKEWKLNNALDHQLKELFIAYNYKKYPNCKMWVEKISGCIHMGYSCGFEFCYGCGGIEMTFQIGNDKYLVKFITILRNGRGVSYLELETPKQTGVWVSLIERWMLVKIICWPHCIIDLSGERIPYTINNNIIVLRITGTTVIYEKVSEGNRGNGIKIKWWNDVIQCSFPSLKRWNFLQGLCWQTIICEYSSMPLSPGMLIW